MVMEKILDFIEYHENSLMKLTESWYGPSYIKSPRLQEDKLSEWDGLGGDLEGYYY